MANEADLYVATNGNDAWSGALPAPSADGTDGPLMTLKAARDRIRGLKKEDSRSYLVLIRGGTYVLDETVVFSLEDSAPPGSRRHGTATGHTITYAAYPGEQPVFTSGVPIRGWKALKDSPDALSEKAKGKVWVADVPAGLGRFLTLYDGATSLPRARTESFWSSDDTPKMEVEGDPFRTMIFPKGKLKAWSNLEDVEIVVRSVYWTVNILALESVDEEACIARTKLPATYPLRPFLGRKSAWVENVLEALDSPGEWVLNMKERKLYLWPIGDTPGDSIVAPRLREFIRVEGEIDYYGPTDIPVCGLIFRGLKFTHGDRDMWTESDAGIQHDWEMIDKPNGLIRFRGAEQCVVEDCTFTNSGGVAVRLDLHCKHCCVMGNEINNLGQGGVMLIGYGPGTKDVNKYNAIINNHIHRCGQIYTHSHGIVLFQSGENRVANNFIHDMPRKAILLTGVRPNWFTYRADPRRECARSIRWHEVGNATEWSEVLPYLHTRNNMVEYNEVARCCQKLGDGAPINITGAGTGNVIRRNYIHDIFTGKCEWSGEDEMLPACIRTDDWQRGTLITENVIFRSNTAALRHKHENAFTNNIVIDVDPTNYINFGRYIGPFERSRFEKNIFINSKGRATFYSNYWPIKGPFAAPGRFAARPAMASCDVDYNIYFNVECPNEMGEDLRELQRYGHDKNSILADPLLMDWKNGDFRLRPDSPGHAMGIISIDVRKAGLLKR